jgi:superfamily II DNA helicase RecQ
MPTGMGKSLVYQLPVLASGGIGIIISPLIALMQQQSQLLRRPERRFYLSAERTRVTHNGPYASSLGRV